MAPRPKIYGTRRSHVRPAGEMVNGTIADGLQPRLKRADVMPEIMSTGKENDLGTARKEGKQDIPLQGLMGEDESVSGTLVEECAAISRTPNDEDKSTIVSAASGSLENRSLSAQDMLHQATSNKENDSCRKSIRRSVNGSANLENQNIISKIGSESIPVDHTSPSHAKADFRPNDSTEDRQPSPVSHDIDLKDAPSDLHNLGIWVARSINVYADKSPISATSEPRQKDSSPRPGQDIETIDALDNVEGVRMTRGKEKKRLQQLRGKGPAIELSGNFVAGVGTLLRPRDVAPVERRLKDEVNYELKRNLFGSSSMKDGSTNVIERNACGKLLFNTLVDVGDSANRNSAAVLKSGLEERKDDAPFLSAFKVLASSPEIMAFINFLFRKDGPQWEASNADESRPSTGVNSFGATTITETSGLTSHAGTSISEAEGLLKAKTRNKARDHKNLERQKRSQEVIPVLEAATTILVKIDQGESGTDYITPYAGGSMITNPIGQPHMTAYGMAYSAPSAGHPTFGIAYGPHLGANVNKYASPYADSVATHPNSYASPFFSHGNQPPADYASPYANPVVPNQPSGSAFVGSVDNQASRHDGHETHDDGKEAHIPHQDIIGAPAEVKKGDDAAAGQDISNEEVDVSKAGKNADEQVISNENLGTNKACDEANGQGVSKENEEASTLVDLDETDVDDAHKQDSSGKEDETSSDDELTDDDLMAATTQNQDIAPPTENHKLFTGERLGDFSSNENIDWLLTMGNGGKIPRPSKKMRMSPPSSSEADAKVQTEVNRIINHIILCKDWRGHPGTMKQLFYASAEGQRLAGESRRLLAIAEPVVNTIIPLAESQARLRFYQQLESRAVKENRDREIQERINRYYGAPYQMQQWGPSPVGLLVAGLAIPPLLPSNGPLEPPFVRRGNVIAVPPGGRNIEEEKKAETYGYPPTPGSRPGGSQRGQKRKRAARH